MSFTYPTSPGFRAIGLKMSDPTVAFRAQNGRRIVRKVGGHLWSFTLTYPPMTKEQFKPVLGFLAKMRGIYNTFTIVPPNLKDPSGTQLLDTLVATDTPAGSTSINVSSASVGATFKAGDVLKFSNHAKVYMITDDSTADSMGNATISFIPPLVSQVTALDSAQHRNIPFTVALKSSIQEVKADVSGLYTYELDVEEVFG